MFLTRFVITGIALVSLATLSGCITHTRTLYQPKPFKTATVPASSTSSDAAAPAPAPAQ